MQTVTIKNTIPASILTAAIKGNIKPLETYFIFNFKNYKTARFFIYQNNVIIDHTPQPPTEEDITHATVPMNEDGLFKWEQWLVNDRIVINKAVLKNYKRISI